MKKILTLLNSFICIFSLVLPSAMAFYPADNMDKNFDSTSIISTFSIEDVTEPMLKEEFSTKKLWTFTVTGNDVRLRRTPSLQGEIIGLMQKGDQFKTEWTDETYAYADGIEWEYGYSVRHNAYGWVSGSYITLA